MADTVDPKTKLALRSFARHVFTLDNQIDIPKNTKARQAYIAIVTEMVVLCLEMGVEPPTPFSERSIKKG